MKVKREKSVHSRSSLNSNRHLSPSSIPSHKSVVNLYKMAINKSTNNKSVLVTGANGYIGAQTVLELLNAGYRVLALGNSKHGQSPVCVLPQCLMRVLVLAKCPGSMLTFRACNLQNAEEVEHIFQNEHFSAVIHLASSKGVAPSIAAPLEYYANNLISSINLFEMCQKYGPKNVVFMSSATVYGVPEQLPVTESSKTGADITNPYGWAKYMVEQMLRDICRSSKDWSVVILRAFDPAGAHSSGLLGEDLSVDGPKQLMPLIASVALGRMEAIRVCGNQFPTRDGSGSRDFVHVMDVARAIVRSLGQFEMEAEEEEGNSGIRVYNLGLGHEHTVLEMIANYERACGKEINKLVTAPRAGDIASIHCDISLAQQQLNWSPEYGVEDICEHLNNWYTLCPRGYNC